VISVTAINDLFTDIPAMNHRLKKMLKWAGVLILLLIPVFFLSKRKRLTGEPEQEESDIFAEEF